MDENKILNEVADTLLQKERVIIYDIEPQSWIHRTMQSLRIKPKKWTVTIKPAYLGTMIRVSKLLLQMGVKPMEQDRVLDLSYEQIVENGPILAEIVAAGIHNKESEPPKWIAKKIRANLTGEELYATAQIIVAKIDILAFWSTIRSVRSANLLKPELSLQKKEEIIASGEPSTPLVNIFASATKM